MTQKELLQPYHQPPCEAKDDPSPNTSTVRCSCGLWRAFIAAFTAKETT